MTHSTITKYFFTGMSHAINNDLDNTTGNVSPAKKYYFTESKTKFADEPLFSQECKEEIEITKEDMTKFHQKAFKTINI